MGTFGPATLESNFNTGFKGLPTHREISHGFVRFSETDSRSLKQCRGLSSQTLATDMESTFR
jgi:hypothetical protein